jgi:riboflavin kinase/FMN adenylyltransferase
MSPSAVTIGNFDGLHAGHRRIMARVVEIARENGWTSTVLTFDPHPTRVVAPSRSPKLMTPVPERERLMLEAGIERVVVKRFTAELAKLSPSEFARTILRDELNARAVLVGANFRFGAQQAGDIHTLRALGEELGFHTEIIAEVRRHGRTVSSSGIRSTIESGDVSLASRLLERPYSIAGDVVPGRGVGSKQTVPTLNLATTAELLPPPGVYITETTGLDGGSRRWDSITNVGYRPTFDDQHGLTIETYLLSPFDDPAPNRIRLDFLRRVRDERKFESPEALKQQILRDVARAQAYFRRRKRWTRC